VVSSDQHAIIYSIVQECGATYGHIVIYLHSFPLHAPTTVTIWSLETINVFAKKLKGIGNTKIDKLAVIL